MWTGQRPLSKLDITRQENKLVSPDQDNKHFYNRNLWHSFNKLSRLSLHT
jgi:hypothetical protein